MSRESTKPDSVRSWEKAVEVGLIQGVPAYYHGFVYDEPSDTWIDTGHRPPEWETSHALITALLAVNGTPWQPPVDPPSVGWGDGKPFGSRQDAGGPIVISGEDGLVMENLSFEGSQYWWQPGQSHNQHVPVRIINSRNVTVRNCDFKDVSQCFSIEGDSSDIRVEYNRVDGIVGPGERVDEQTGNFLQTVSSQIRRVNVMDNKIKVPTDVDPWNGQYERFTEDVISFFAASDCSAIRNRIEATGYVRDSGTGIIAGDATGNQHLIADNWLLNPGQVGLACAGGSGHIFDGNRIWKDSGQVAGSGNRPAYYWPQYSGGGSGEVTNFTHNRAKWNDGPDDMWVADGGEDTLYTEGNDWDDDTLNRADFEVTL